MVGCIINSMTKQHIMKRHTMLLHHHPLHSHSNAVSTENLIPSCNFVREQVTEVVLQVSLSTAKALFRVKAYCYSQPQSSQQDFPASYGLGIHVQQVGTLVCCDF